PRGGRTDCVRNVCCGKYAAERDHGDRKQPEIPRHDKSGELVEAELCPLINAALERHQPVQINNDRSLRNVKKQNRKQPKEQMRLSEFGSGADPGGADDEKNLRQDEIVQAERLFERNAVFLNVALGAI